MREMRENAEIFASWTEREREIEACCDEIQSRERGPCMGVKNIQQKQSLIYGG